MIIIQSSSDRYKTVQILNTMWGSMGCKRLFLGMIYNSSNPKSGVSNCKVTIIPCTNLAVCDF